MKRRLFKLVVFLILGAIVNVAVAWGILAATVWLNSTEEPEQEVGFWPPDNPEWEIEMLRYKGHASFVCNNFSRVHSEFFFRPIREWLPRWAFCRTESPTTVHGLPIYMGNGGLVEQAAGWPLLALQSPYRWTFIPSDGWTTQVELLGPGIVVSTDRKHKIIGLPFVLPLRPIWPGFAINTMFYVALLWLLTLGPFTARRMIRRKRGRCIKCGYDLRGTEHEVCPECGKELSAKAKL